MKKRRKLAARSIDEPWTVSIWEPPEYITETVLIQKKTDQDGKRISQYQNVEVLNDGKRLRKIRSSTKKSQGT